MELLEHGALVRSVAALPAGEAMVDGAAASWPAAEAADDWALRCAGSMLLLKEGAAGAQGERFAATLGTAAAGNAVAIAIGRTTRHVTVETLDQTVEAWWPGLLAIDAVGGIQLPTTFGQVQAGGGRPGRLV